MTAIDLCYVCGQPAIRWCDGSACNHPMCSDHVARSTWFQVGRNGLNVERDYCDRCELLARLSPRARAIVLDLRKGGHGQSLPSFKNPSEPIGMTGKLSAS